MAWGFMWVPHNLNIRVHMFTIRKHWDRIYEHRIFGISSCVLVVKWRIHEAWGRCFCILKSNLSHMIEALLLHLTGLFIRTMRKIWSYEHALTRDPILTSKFEFHFNLTSQRPRIRTEANNEHIKDRNHLELISTPAPIFIAKTHHLIFHINHSSILLIQ